MASWPENPRLIGTKIPRLDGLAKASGRAKYPSDVRPEGTLFGVMLYSPYAHAKIKSIDTSAAEKMPGVKAVSTIAEAGTTLRYHGDDIAAVAAETEEQARDAVRAIKVEYEVLPHVVTEHLAMAEGAPEVFKGGNVRKGRAQTKGKPEEAMAKADVMIEGTYCLPVITHVCLEPHGLTVKWEGADKMTVWASTQAVQGVAGELADALNIPVANVTVLTDYMGGGFGSKFGADVWGRTAAELAKKAAAPGQDVPRPCAGAPGGGQPAQRRGQHQAGGDQGRQDRRHDRRDPRHRRRRRRLELPPALCLRCSRLRANP